MYSAKKIYLEKHLAQGNVDWPVKIVDPEIEDLYRTEGKAPAEKRLLQRLAEDYDSSTLSEEIKGRSWYGRCVWEADNNVCDDQIVTLTWEDDYQPAPAALDDEKPKTSLQGRAAKTAVFHHIAYTQAQCERRGRIYGTKGEITYDSTTISVYDFATGKTTTHKPKIDYQSGHGGGDSGLARQFVEAVGKVKMEGWTASKAQKQFLGCTLEELVRSHVAVWAAEEARVSGSVVRWQDFWEEKVCKLLAD